MEPDGSTWQSEIPYISSECIVRLGEVKQCHHALFLLIRKMKRCIVIVKVNGYSIQHLPPLPFSPAKYLLHSGPILCPRILVSWEGLLFFFPANSGRARGFHSLRRPKTVDTFLSFFLIYWGILSSLFSCPSQYSFWFRCHHDGITAFDPFRKPRP